MLALRPVGILLAAAVLGSCGLVPGNVGGPGFSGAASCGDIFGGACQAQIDLAAARHPGATLIEVTCTVLPCDRKGGAGTVVVTLASGAKVTEAFSYTGDPAPIPAPACAGMAMEVCRQIAASTVDGLPPSQAIRAISVSCSSSSCTLDHGEADVRVQFGDGSEFQTNSGWAGGPP